MGQKSTSWEHVAGKYQRLVGVKGSFFHQAVIIPKSMQLLGLNAGIEKQPDGQEAAFKILEFACGQGIFSRSIPENIEYTGIDISPTLIKFAEEQQPNHDKSKKKFLVGDITAILDLPENYFSHCIIILALQNIRNIKGVMQNAAKLLQPGGKFLLILNHPMFRIPRQSGWKIDADQKIQYRYINRYYSPMAIPVNMTPGADKAVNTWSYHYPLEYYSKLLHEHNFVIEIIEEWLSPKISTGKAAKMENLARHEIPMFMAILAEKKPAFISPDKT